ncbi:MAG: TIR domain-containing protein [Methylocystis sp.]|uniref:toll/interleukin-1 receptor domain-containing protein n=1 Tax=Methylocystis sp. TaxID=1911079 RepID=UPI003951CF9F
MPLEKLKIFISYSRRDALAADALVGALISRGFEVTIDRRDLPFGEKWQGELAEFIRLSDTVIWLISYASVHSSWVNWELDEVTKRSKRLVPVMVGPTAREMLPRQLGEIHILPVEGVFNLGRDLDALVQVLETDRSWLKEASRLQDRATEWLTKKRTPALLLSRGALADAERWKALRPAKAPAPAQEVLDLLLASHQAATRRQRRWISAALGVTSGALFLSGLAVWQWSQAESRTQLAQEQKARYFGARAENAVKESDVDLAKWAFTQATEAVGSHPLVPGNIAVGAEILRYDHLKALLVGSESPLKLTVLSPDGYRVLTVSEDGAAAVWNALTGQRLLVLPDKAKVAAFSPDGRRIASAWDDGFGGVARLSDAKTGETLRVLAGDVSEVQSIRFSPEGSLCAAAIYGGTIHIWKVTDGESVRVLKEAGEAFSFDESGQLIVSGGDDGWLNVWDVQTGILSTHIPVVRRKANSGFGVRIASFRPGKNEVLATAHDRVMIFDENKRPEIVRSYDGYDYPWEAYLWSAKDGRLMQTFRGHTGPIYDAKFSADGNRLLTASFDATARLWDVETGREIQTFRGHSGAVYRAIFSHSDTRVWTASDDTTVRQWDIETGGSIRVMRGHRAPVHSLDISRDNRHVISASSLPHARVCSHDACEEFDPIARVWGIEPQGLVRTLGGFRKKIVSLAHSPRGKSVAVVGDDGVAEVWDLTAGEKAQAIRGHEGAILAVGYSPDGARLVTASEDHTARVWDTVSLANVAVLKGHTATVWAVHYSRDGTKIVTASEDGTARLWDSQTGQLLFTLGGHEQPISDAGFNFDERFIFTLPYNGEIAIWRSDSGSLIHRLKGHEGPVLSVAFTPDGARVVSASDDRTVRVWDAQSGHLLHVLTGHSKRVTALRVTPDSQWAISASDDGTARIWNIHTGKLMRTLVGHEGSISTMSLNADGTQILTGSSDGSARLWDFASGETLQVFQGEDGEITAASILATTIVTASVSGNLRVWEGVPSVQALIGYLQSSMSQAMTAAQLREFGIQRVADLNPDSNDNKQGPPRKRGTSCQILENGEPYVTSGAKSDAEAGELYWIGGSDCSIELDKRSAFTLLNRTARAYGARFPQESEQSYYRVLAQRANLARRLPLAEIGELSALSEGSTSSNPFLAAARIAAKLILPSTGDQQNIKLSTRYRDHERLQR